MESIKKQLEGIGVDEKQFAELLDDCSMGMDAERVAEDLYSDDYHEPEKSLTEKVSDYLPPSPYSLSF